MAKFTDYTQKTKPADADLLLIHDNAGAANKKTPFSGVWSWILDKLASAVISQLETKNKSIIPAINELNSKMDTGILITRNIDNFSLNANTTEALTIELGSEIINNYLPIRINNVTNGKPLIIGNSWISGNSYKISVTNNAYDNIENVSIVIYFLAKSLA